jgi:hypothetical protein
MPSFIMMLAHFPRQGQKEGPLGRAQPKESPLGPLGSGTNEAYLGLLGLGRGEPYLGLPQPT